MKIYKYILFLVAVLLLSACDGEYEDAYYDETYIDWAGSVNGTFVVDATDDIFEFEITTGYLHFGSTTYTNVWVDSFGDFYIDSVQIGAVYYVRSIDNETITALISNDGYYIDLYGPESNLAWAEALTMPIYAFKSATAPTRQIQETIYTQTAQQADVKTSAQATPPEMNINAHIEDLPAKNTSTLSKYK